MDEWLAEAKQAPDADKVGMYLVHNGIVRKTAKAKVRKGETDAPDVVRLFFDSDQEKVEAAIAEAKKMEGIYYIRVWLNEGELEIGDSIMYVLVGGDIRPHVIDCLQSLVGTIKNECVVEKEITG
jgi:molybdopterin synthase catalytic subunit